MISFYYNVYIIFPPLRIWSTLLLMPCWELVGLFLSAWFLKVTFFGSLFLVSIFTIESPAFLPGLPGGRAGGGVVVVFFLLVLI